jgi:hypothetical protein
VAGHIGQQRILQVTFIGFTQVMRSRLDMKLNLDDGILKVTKTQLKD